MIHSHTWGSGRICGLAFPGFSELSVTKISKSMVDRASSPSWRFRGMWEASICEARLSRQ